VAGAWLDPTAVMSALDVSSLIIAADHKGGVHTRDSFGLNLRQVVRVRWDGAAQVEPNRQSTLNQSVDFSSSAFKVSASRSNSQPAEALVGSNYPNLAWAQTCPESLLG